MDKGIEIVKVFIQLPVVFAFFKFNALQAGAFSDGTRNP